MIQQRFRSAGRQETSVRPDVLVDLLALAHPVLVGEREPDELRVRRVDRERMIGPGLAAVRGVDPRAPVADRPGALRRRARTTESRFTPSACFEFSCWRPGGAAVLGAQDQAELPDRPADLLVRHRDVVEQLLGARVRLLPALAAVVAHVDRAPVAHGDDVVRLGHRDREEIVVDVDLAARLVGLEVILVARQRRQRQRPREQRREGPLHRGYRPLVSRPMSM